MTEYDPGARAAPMGAQRGCLLPCPRCGEPDANIALELAEDDLFTCHDCQQEFTAPQLRALAERRAPVLAWLDLRPAAQGGE